jgi:hypothetical protein
MLIVQGQQYDKLRKITHLYWLLLSFGLEGAPKVAMSHFDWPVTQKKPETFKAF